MLYNINFIAHKNTLLYFIKVEFKSFFMTNIDKYKIAKNANICKTLFLVYLSFFRINFL